LTQHCYDDRGIGVLDSSGRRNTNIGHELGQFSILLRVHCVSIWGALYSLKKNKGSGGVVTSFRDKSQTCASSVHVD